MTMQDPIMEAVEKINKIGDTTYDEAVARIENNVRGTLQVAMESPDKVWIDGELVPVPSAGNQTVLARVREEIAGLRGELEIVDGKIFECQAKIEALRDERAKLAVTLESWRKVLALLLDGEEEK